MHIRTRTIVAFLIAPISFGLLLVAGSIFTGGTFGGVFLYLSLSAMIGYSLAVLIGLPAYVVMRKLGANGIRSYSFMAMIFALILISSLIVFPTYSDNGGDLSSLLSQPRIYQMAILTVASFFTVFAFWFIARPDLDAN